MAINIYISICIYIYTEVEREGGRKRERGNKRRQRAVERGRARGEHSTTNRVSICNNELAPEGFGRD